MKNVPGKLQPDLVLWHKNGKVTIIDVTVPYKADERAFEKERNEKKDKYQLLADWLKNNGHADVVIIAFIVGALGSWDPSNESVLKHWTKVC